MWVCHDIRVDPPVGGTVHSTTLPTEGEKEGEREGGREGGREEGRMRGRTGDYMYTVHVHVLYMQCTCSVHVGHTCTNCIHVRVYVQYMINLVHVYAN